MIVTCNVTTGTGTVVDDRRPAESSLKTQERVKSQKTGKVKTRGKSLKLIVKNKVKVKNGK